MVPRASDWHDPHEVRNDKMFGTLTVLSDLLERIAPNTGWRDRLLRMVLGLSARNQQRMGFPGQLARMPNLEAIPAC